MKNTTYNKIVKLIQDVCNKHKMVKEFGEGSISDLTTTKDFNYPLTWLVEDSVTQKIGATGIMQEGEYKLNLLCMDLVNSDESNRREIQSDSLGILIDIVNYIQTSPTFQNEGLIISRDVMYYPFAERFEDNVTGHRAELYIKFPFSRSYCQSAF